MLTRRNLLKGLGALVPIPLVHRQGSLTVCPASEITSQSPHRPLLSMSVDMSGEIDKFIFIKDKLQPYFPEKSRLSVDIEYLNKNNEVREVSFHKVEEVKFYEDFLNKFLIKKQTSSTTHSQSHYRNTTSTSFNRGFTVFFDIDTIRLYNNNNIFCAIKI